MRMRRRIGTEQCGGVYLCVALRGREGRVAEQFLDRAQVSARAQQEIGRAHV